MKDQQYVATLSQSQGRPGWSILFRHPQPHESQGKPGLRVRRGLGTTDQVEAEAMVAQMNELLADRTFWNPAAREQASRLFPRPVVSAFFDPIGSVSTDYMSIRESFIPLPGRGEGYARVMLLGTYGAGKTSLVRQMIGTDPERERFPSTAPSKTTTADIEIVMTGGDHRAVVTFLPREHARAYTEDCVIAAALAAVDGGDNNDIKRKLLEHRDQRYRLGYLLGTGPRAPVPEPASDDDEESTEGAHEIGATSDDTPHLPSRVQEYVTKIQDIAREAASDLGRELGVTPSEASGEERDAFEELLEEELRGNDVFHQLIDEIIDDVESRFAVLQEGHTEARPDGWPISFSFNCGDDRSAFIARVNRFSTNNARLFGRLLTPLVQGIRVSAPFSPLWGDGNIPRLVLIDGEGFGHTSSTPTSLSSATMQRLADVDVVLLVDNAAQPMQAGPAIILKSLVTSGHESKLRLAFTKFDLVRGASLGDMMARQHHVKASLDQAISGVGQVLSRSAERALHRALKGNVFFLSDIRRASKDLSRFASAQLGGLLDSLTAAVAETQPILVAPIYDEANLVIRMQRALREYHEAWHARMGLPSQAAIPREHWTRVKAMTRWISQLNQEGYDTLTPVSDLEQAIRDTVYIFLENPVKWDPPTEDPDLRALSIAAVCAEVNARLRRFTMRRVIAERFPDWSDAYAGHSGTGSTRRRARAIEDIYQTAAPVPGESPDRHGNQFLIEIRELVREAIQAAGGRVLSIG